MEAVKAFRPLPSCHGDTVPDVLELITRGTAEVVTEEELQTLLAGGGAPKAYVGLEPSGLVHLGTGALVGGKVADLHRAGFDVTILLADWHAYINDKFGGDWEALEACGAYFEEAFLSLGVPEGVRFVRARELVADPEYWKLVLRVFKASTLARIRRALPIMGREEAASERDPSKLVYPAMQVADIHVLDLDLAYGGMDQRHAHMLYRDLAPKLGWKQVVALHTPLLSSLQGGGRMDAWDAKMSKSRPDTAVFIHDTAEEIQAKIEKAFCPPGEVEGNPILQFCEYVLLPRFGRVTVEREARHGGDVTFEAYGELEAAYREGDLHPKDLKDAVARGLDAYLADSRAYFARRPEALRRMRSLLG